MQFSACVSVLLFLSDDLLLVLSQNIHLRHFGTAGIVFKETTTQAEAHPLHS
jgi:hypothetical protein